jgi:molybdenum cofactor cytidylyltransferase
MRRSGARVGSVVLAAGGSRRLGRPKQLVRVAGRTLVRRAVDAAVGAGCDPVVLVVGAAADEVVAEIAGGGAAVTVVTCAGWSEGLAATLRAGVAAVAALESPPGALLLVPCDQPALEPAVLRRLIDAWDGSPEGRVGCAYAGTLGAPALFRGRSSGPRAPATSTPRRTSTAESRPRAAPVPPVPSRALRSGRGDCSIILVRSSRVGVRPERFRGRFR